MQFDTNSDYGPPSLLKEAAAQNPIPFPPVDPSPCARITVRVWHRNTIMTVQNVLVKTCPPPTTTTTTTASASNSNNNSTTGGGGGGGGGVVRRTSHMNISTRSLLGATTGRGNQGDDGDDDDEGGGGELLDEIMSSSSSSSSSSFSSDNDDEMIDDDDDSNLIVGDHNNNNDAAAAAAGQPPTLGTSAISSVQAPPLPPHGNDAGATTTSPLPPLAAAGPPEYAYWMQRTIRDAIYGRVVLAVVLTRIHPTATTTTTTTTTTSSSSSASAAQHVVTAEWQVTDQKCAIKEMSWQHIRRERNRLAEDPIQEVAALAYLQQHINMMESTNRNTTLTAATINAATTTTSTNWESLHVSSLPTNYTTSSTMATTSTSSAATTTTFPSQLSSSLPTTTTTLQTSIQSNVLLPLDLLSDDRFLYSILPFCNGGELFDRLDRREKFPEPEARYWMHQIVNGVEHLQRAGICHRDLSLENLLVHDSHALVIDMGMCLRIPHAEVDPSQQYYYLQQQQAQSTTTTTTTNVAVANNAAGPLESSMYHMHLTNTSNNNNFIGGSITTLTTATTSNIFQNAAAASTMTINNSMVGPQIMGVDSNIITTVPAHLADRRLLPRYKILPQGTCGKWIYMSPEILQNKEPFDGHAVDMWAVGVILFLMLTGFPPWERACAATDERFYYMTQGYLVQMLTEWNLGLSSDAMDLLQRMLWADPQDRLSLEQVKAHPWMMRKDMQAPPPELQEQQIISRK